MGIVLRFPHVGACSTIGFKKASIGMMPPETPLKRLARPRDASLRPAKILRRCASEQSAASASCLTDIPLNSAQRNIGCCSDMALHISTRNDKSQPAIFPLGTSLPVNVLVTCDMAKKTDGTPPTIHLGDWLEFFETTVGEAAEIAGCNQSYISNIIAGRKLNVNVLYLLKLSDALGITINDFYRPLPNKSHLNALKNLSPKAQATILSRQEKKA